MAWTEDKWRAKLAEVAAQDARREALREARACSRRETAARARRQAAVRRSEADRRKSEVRWQADLSEALEVPAPSPEVAEFLRHRRRMRAMSLQLRAGLYDGVPVSDDVLDLVTRTLGETPKAIEVTTAITPEVVSPGGRDLSVERAAKLLRKASPKAMAVIIKSLGSNNEWVGLTAARAIMERTLPASAVADQNAGPLIVLPPGTRFALVADPAEATPVERGIVRPAPDEEY